MQNIRIDTEFKALLRPLSQEERDGLTRSLKEQGCLDALKVWGDILIDGHNRYAICQEHNIPFQIQNVHFDSRQDALNWIIDYQLEHRNLTPKEQSFLRGMRYISEKKSVGAPKENKNAGKQRGHFVPFVSKTSEVIAQKTGVTDRTVKRDAQFTAAVNALTDVAGPEIKHSILTGETRTTKQDVVTLGKLAASEPEKAKTLVRKVVEDGQSLKDAMKETKREEQKAHRKEIAEALQEPTQQIASLDDRGRIYRVIYADPPWTYGNDQTAALPGSSRPDDHYIPMPTADICALPVQRIALHDSVLFLWSTTAHLKEALSVIDAWGFQYKTHLIWDKESHNYGPYTSVQHEILLLATRGACTPEKSGSIPSVVRIQKTAHSEKPEAFRDFIQQMYPFGQRIEMFARRPVDGWDTWGNECSRA